jgi:hypothetical protein
LGDGQQLSVPRTLHSRGRRAQCHRYMVAAHSQICTGTKSRKKRGFVVRRLRAILAALLLGVLASSALAEPAGADSFEITVQSVAPEQGIPVGLRFSGTASPVAEGYGPYLYAVVRPAGGIACQSSYGSDQAAAGGASETLRFGDWGEAHTVEVGPGSFEAQITFNPSAVGPYIICAWLEKSPFDESHSPFPASEVTAGPLSATFTARGPQVSALNVSTAGATLPGVGFQINYTTQTDQQLQLYSIIKPAGGLPCALSFQLDQQQNQAELNVFNDNVSIFGGPTVTSATETEQYSGPYIICAWIEGPSQGEVDATVSANIYVGTPPQPPPTHHFRCTVPRIRRNARLARVKSQLAAHHCRVGRVRYVHSYRVHRGFVVGLGQPTGRHLPSNAPINVIVSSGPRRHQKRGRHSNR